MKLNRRKKMILSLAIFYSFFGINVIAQTLDSAAVSHYKTIIQLIMSDNDRELSKHVLYPLHRENPLPDIANSTEFIRAYPILFDSAFKEKLKIFQDSDVFEHHGLYGLVGENFSGDLWMDDDGNLYCINYSSKAEQTIRKELVRRQKQTMHESIRSWDENILVAKSRKLLIRLDKVDTTIRYASWSKGKSQSEKPDIIIYNGIEQAQGTMGGWTWTFENNGWTYLIDDVELSDSVDRLGYFLIVSKNDKVISNSRLTLIK